MEPNPTQLLDRDICSKARLARDARFDGLFFTGVKTTGIFCRSICPATPKEINVDYYPTALAAAQDGLRPCLRCRPECAPGSPAWQGVQTTLARALRMIGAGEWRDQSLPEFAERLGVSDRYLRKLFQRHLGISPLKYANFSRALFAKQLLQETKLPITIVAEMSGFSSTRCFNRVFVEITGLSPGQLRKTGMNTEFLEQDLTIFLSYRPPYDWSALLDFYRQRQISGLEVVTDNSYSRSFYHDNCEGDFTATVQPKKNGFAIRLRLNRPETTLAVVQRIRRLLDLDADAGAIATHLSGNPLLVNSKNQGIRLPGIWSPFEAGVRAILGQQVSVKAAQNLVTRLVKELGSPSSFSSSTQHDETRSLLFPLPEAVAHSSLEFLAIPDKRRQALRLLAQHLLATAGKDGVQERFSIDKNDYNDWLTIPGIGPWTVQYTAFRMGHPDIFLAGDLGVKNALKKLTLHQNPAPECDPRQLSPWGSYATLQLWQSLSNPSTQNNHQ